MGAQRIERSGLRSEMIPICLAAVPAGVRDALLCCPSPASVAGDEAPSIGTVIGVVGITIVLGSPVAPVVPIIGESLAAGVGEAVALRTSAMACAVASSPPRAA